MNDAWDALTLELDQWGAEGRTAAFWWRDDDAVAPTPALDRLRSLSAGIPIALAVIPAGATPELAAELRDWPESAVLQHGLSHANHETAPAKKAELGAARPAAHVIADLKTGWDMLASFDPLPVLVPPWNRISPDLIGQLPGLGYIGLSTFTRARKPTRRRACFRSTPTSISSTGMAAEVSPERKQLSPPRSAISPPAGPEPPTRLSRPAC